MAKINEIIKVRDDIVFGGAVQVDWFYKEKACLIAENFVFHGPDFFGVTEGDIGFSEHKLMDTCSYADLISKKLVEDSGNPIILTIAGYGTGKSHMAVTLGKLFENSDVKIVKAITKNLQKADVSLAENISKNNTKRNLVLVLNGMRDFNLNIEILNASKKVLNKYGYTEEFFSDITKAYTIAKIFVERNFDIHNKLFEQEFKEESKYNENLKEFLIENVYKDTVFNSINNVYENVNGNRIRWDEGITASDILSKLNERLCGENGEFNKILILFDEFGRFIEFAADRPELAGDSTLQQIYETIQDSNNNIIMVGFIQSDLKTYMARVKKSSSIARYIGRYESGEKIYLSSNLETIFANLITRTDSHLFKEYIVDTIEYSENNKKYEIMYKDINSWSAYANSKGIWSNQKKFMDVLVKGIYPMSPLSVLLLTSLSDWYQQRSALNFFIDAVKRLNNKEIDKLSDLPQIYPVDIINGEFFTELLLAEKEGRQKSENCMLFNQILVKHGEKLTDMQKNTLASILVFKLLRFNVIDKEELLRSFSYIMGINKSSLNMALTLMEEDLGIISFDEKRNVFDFVEDATGQNDFKVQFNRIRNRLDYTTMESLITGEIKNELGIIGNLQTDFSKIHNIRTNEWTYKQEFKTINELDEFYLKSLVDNFNKSTQVNVSKGMFIYVYVSKNDNYEKVINLYKRLNLQKYPIIFWILDDAEEDLYNAFFNERVINAFSKEEKSKFDRFINKFLETNKLDMRNIFKSLQSKKEIISKEGIIKVDRRMKVLLKEKFEELYPDIIPFPFEGFTNKQLAIPKKNLSVIAKSLLAGKIDYSWIQLQDKSMRNIVSQVLVYPEIGWGVLNDNYSLQYPTNKKLYKLFNQIDKSFNSDKRIYLIDLYTKCTSTPIGMNDYAFSLFLAVYLHFKGIEAKILFDDKVIKYSDWGIKYFLDKSVDIALLNKSYIIKVNIEGYLKKYQILCNEIENESNLSRLEELLSKLEDLEQENDIPEELIEKVQACHMRLEVGIDTLKKLRSKICHIKGEFNRGTDSDIDYKFLLHAMVMCKELIKDENKNKGHFDISVEELDVIEEMLIKGNEIVEEHYLEYLMKQKCRAVSQVGPYRKWLERIAENLKSLGYPKLETETLMHMEKTTSNMENIRRVQEAVNKCETYLKITKPTKYSTQDELINWMKNGKNLLELINKNQALDKRDKERFITGLNNTLEQIKSFLNDITAKITKVYDDAFEIKSLDNAEQVRTLIEELLEKGIRNEEKEYIEAIGRIIGSCINEVRDVRKNLELAYRESRVMELIEKYQELNDDVDLIPMLNSYINEINDEIFKENKYWIEKMKLETLNSIEEWDAQQCQSFLTRTNKIPDFISEKNIIKVNKCRNMVNNRIKVLKIDSVVELFKVLDEGEKQDCINILKELLS
ncbi:hypothetical protein [Vallitalea guaymasensis]|uniref:hypothetical protein n=1 Tax=Vallitalea guaymasensis TaxID=1185412 RepID=UPI000DE1EAF6|nr:hypothetical protein [Vallitalea guaymasensis]